MKRFIVFVPFFPPLLVIFKWEYGISRGVWVLNLVPKFRSSPVPPSSPPHEKRLTSFEDRLATTLILHDRNFSTAPPHRLL